jgi:hypothetical protein
VPDRAVVNARRASFAAECPMQDGDSRASATSLV